MQAAMAAIVMVTLSAAIAEAQNNSAASTPKTAEPPRLDFSGSFFRTFTKATTGNGTEQTPVNSEGGMIGARYVQSPFLGFELTYSLNPYNQKYAPDAKTCTYTCSNTAETIPSKASVVAGDWVVSKTSGNLRPFAVGGLAFVISVSTGDAYALNTIVRGGYVYGGGVDWGSPKFGLRVQYRGTVFKAPNLTSAYFPTGKFTQIAEPMVGVYFRP